MTRREDIHDHRRRRAELESDLVHFAKIWADRGLAGVATVGDPNNRQGFERFDVLWDAAKLPVPAVVHAHFSAFNSRLQHINVEYWAKVAQWGEDYQ